MRLTFRAIILLALGLTACPKPKPKPAPTCVTTHQICGVVSGAVCGVCPDDGVCAADGLSCRPALAIGSACAANLDCGENRVCIGAADGIQAPGGYCSKSCTAAAPCPIGSTCALDVKGDSVCLADCGAPGTPACRTSDGYWCTTAGYCAACVGNCQGKVCGDDGCGNPCGMSSAMMPACSADGQVCSGNQCAAAFAEEGPLPQSDYAGLWDAAAFDLNGQALLVGGREVADYSGFLSQSRGVAKVEIYDPTQQQIVNRLTPMTTPIARPHAALYNGDIYVAGGITDADVVNTPDVADSHFYIYKGNNLNWLTDTAAPIPEPSMGGGLAVIGSTLYLVPGVTADGTLSSSLHSYDPTADAWDTPSAPPARPSARSFVGVASDGMRLYVVGGWDGQEAVAKVETFNVSTGWTTLPDLVVPTTDPKVAIASGRLFVFGGRIGPNPMAAVVPYVQTVDLSTHATSLIGTTYQGLCGQAPVTLRTGAFLLFGAQEFAPSSTATMVDNDVLAFTVPSP
jgi:hypothetical protein